MALRAASAYYKLKDSRIELLSSDCRLLADLPLPACCPAQWPLKAILSMLSLQNISERYPGEELQMGKVCVSINLGESTNVIRKHGQEKEEKENVINQSR